MKIPQLSVFLENRPHSLLEPLQALAAAGINLSGLTLADSEQFGILRLVLRDWPRARDVLQTAGWAVTVTDMVAIDVDDQPGGLVRTLEVLAAADANIEYMYGFFLRSSGRAAMLFRFDDPAAAIVALQAAGVEPVKADALY
ncbi:MAG: amino acid-binding protein [Thauera sp.]|nr:amino acid-binding protein [Thauera sp.]